MKHDWKIFAPDVLIIILFVLASVIYCWPVFEGKVLHSADSAAYIANTNETFLYNADHADPTWWNGRVFSGMPTYQLGGSRYLPDRVMAPVRWLSQLGSKNSIFILLFYMVAFYVLMRTFRIDKWLSLAGAFATALSSYFLIIIAAHHMTKTMSITWLTLVLVGFIIIFHRSQPTSPTEGNAVPSSTPAKDGRHYLWGGLMVMFFSSISFYLHPQMSYYMCMLIGVLYVAEFYVAAREKCWRHLGIATCVFALSLGIGMGVGAPNALATSEYATQSMRGGHSDLTHDDDAAAKTSGLDIEYATAWSEGRTESFTFLIPNLMGGMTGYNLGEKSHVYQELTSRGVSRQQAKQFCQQLPTFWGEKQFTLGPVYMGAVVCFLFVLGLLIVGGPMKWALVVATAFSMLLAMGRNFMPLTEFFFNYFPLYNKFRAVESILVVAEITVPLLGFLALKEIADGRLERKRLLRSIYIAGGITGGVCLFFALFGTSVLSFTSSFDESWRYNIAGDKQLSQVVYNAILADRASMMRADAWRSLLFVAAGVVLTWLFAQQKIKTQWVGLALAALIVADMWPVDKRFFNDSNYITKRERDRSFALEDYERQVLADQTPHFRVFNMATNTFNDARTSYRLKSIGGYSAAKLRRYQDIIDEHLITEMNPLMNAIIATNGDLTSVPADSIYPVLNMLNMRYAIVPLQGGQKMPVYNPHAMGNAWIVDSVCVVSGANAECEALRTLDLHTTAVVDTTFADYAAVERHAADSTDHVQLLSYEPCRLEYDASTHAPATIVFSEVYYPFGWKVTIDDEPADHFRVNYLLRAVNVGPGRHHIVFTFDPDSLHRGNIIGLTCIGLMLLTLIAAIFVTWRRRKADVANV